MDEKERIKNYHCMVMQAELFNNLQFMHACQSCDEYSKSISEDFIIYKLVQSEDH